MNCIKKTTAMFMMLILLMSCVTGIAHADNREVHLAIQASCAFIPLIIARENGWIDEAMKEIGVETVWTDFESGPPMNESFAAGQQDIGVIGDVPAVSAVVRGQKNVYIAAEKGGTFLAILIRDDSGITSVEDLKGKKIGLTIGSTSQNCVQKILAKAGLDINEDVELINITVGDAQIVLTSGDVDAVAIWEPSVSRLAALDGVSILADGGEAGFLGMNIVFARKEFVDQNPDIVKVYLQQYWRATKAFEENPEEFIPMLAEYFRLDEALVKQASAKCEYVLQFGEEETEALQDTVSFLIGIGAIMKEIDVREYITDGIAREVIEESK